MANALNPRRKPRPKIDPGVPGNASLASVLTPLLTISVFASDGSGEATIYIVFDRPLSVIGLGSEAFIGGSSTGGGGYPASGYISEADPRIAVFVWPEQPGPITNLELASYSDGSIESPSASIVANSGPAAQNIVFTPVLTLAPPGGGAFARTATQAVANTTTTAKRKRSSRV